MALAASATPAPRKTCIGCGTQINAIAEVIETNLPIGIPRIAIGIVFGIVTAVIILGGIESIATVCEKLVPVMALFYVLGCIVILGINADYILPAVKAILTLAFQPGAVAGGLVGGGIRLALQYGVARGLFSNEAGMGSTPHAHALANVDCPHDQGVVAMIGVFIDTFVVLTLNALVITSTLYTEGGPLHDCGAAAASTTLGKANLAQTAFGVVFGESAGNMFVAVCLFFFAFSTILSWNLFGKINAIWLFGKKNPKACTVVYALIALVFILMGTMMSNDLVWELTDMFNNLMVIPNAVALFALTSLVVKHADDPNRIPGKK